MIVWESVCKIWQFFFRSEAFSLSKFPIFDGKLWCLLNELTLDDHPIEIKASDIYPYSGYLIEEEDAVGGISGFLA